MYKLITVRNLLFITEMYLQVMDLIPLPVAARSKVRVCGHSLAGIAVLNPIGGLDVWLL
jgi:hypothetical protein